MSEQEELLKNKKYGDTQRLGNYPCSILPKTLASRAYGESKQTVERHRHRYEFNNQFRSALESRGLVVSGINPQRNLVEIVELKERPFFLGAQFHPEFKSQPLKPHPLFKEFIRACSKVSPIVSS